MKKRFTEAQIIGFLREAEAGLEWRALLTAGDVATQAAIARREGITRARVTQNSRAASPRARNQQPHSVDAQYGGLPDDHRTCPPTDHAVR